MCWKDIGLILHIISRLNLIVYLFFFPFKLMIICICKGLEYKYFVKSEMKCIKILLCYINSKRYSSLHIKFTYQEQSVSFNIDNVLRLIVIV